MSNMKIILAADMHLKPGVYNEQNKALEIFLDECMESGKLILLGDTFNCWFEKKGKYVGDYKDILGIFKQAVKAGLEVSMVCGNRDFAFSRGNMTPLGTEYQGFTLPMNNSYSALSEIGVHLEGWACEFEQNGIKYHCSHGDMYCTDNVWHQLLRYLLMGNPARYLSTFVPRLFVNMIFKAFRAYDREARSNNYTIYDYLLIKDEALVPIINSGVDHIICGHLHQHMTREILGSERAGILTVLPCWAGGGYGVLENQLIEIKNISYS